MLTNIILTIIGTFYIREIGHHRSGKNEAHLKLIEKQQINLRFALNRLHVWNLYTTEKFLLIKSFLYISTLQIPIFFLFKLMTYVLRSYSVQTNLGTTSPFIWQYSFSIMTFNNISNDTIQKRTRIFHFTYKKSTLFFGIARDWI